jgi:chromosomal replication initiation ATPase DnaA
LIIDEYKNNIEEKLFYSILNQSHLSNQYIIVNSVKPIQSFELKLNDLKSRFDSFVNIAIDLPTDELIKVIISKNFSDKQVKIESKLLEYIIKNIDRSYEAIFDLIDKLDNFSLSAGKSININLIKKALNK